MDQSGCDVRFVPKQTSCVVPAMVERARSLDAALWSGKLGPIEAECFADLANRTGVKIMALTN